MVNHLHEAKVTAINKNRTTPSFIDPVESGWQKLAMTDWLKNALVRHLVDDSTDLQGEELDLDSGHREGELDFDYELSDVV